MSALARAGLAMLVFAGAVTACGSDDDSGERRGPTTAAASRVREYLAYATEELEPGNALNLIAHYERARRESDYVVDDGEVTPGAFADVFERIDGFEDTTDFDLLYLVNLWYGYRDELPTDVREAIEERLFGFKYWYTEPTPQGVVDDKYYWSENHRIIFHVDEYLAGQAFPDAEFTNDGRTGAEHRDEARERILTWIDEKARFGFTEWHSDVYYQKDVTPLLSLVEWAEDPEVAERAAMVLDLVLFDVALHLHRGNLGTTHGRSYMKDKSTAVDQNTFGFSKLLFGDTDVAYDSRSDPGAVLFSRARKYELPPVLASVARSQETLVDRERMGVPLDDQAPIESDPEAPYGYDFDDPANIPFWWERGGHIAWQVLPTTLETLDRHGLWDSQFFSPFESLASSVSGNPDVARRLARDLAPMLGFGLLSEVNTYSYRSPEVMLSTAQDWRPGVFSEQAHAWQATLDEQALVFTTHPKNEPERGTEWPDSDGYWTGTGSMPRSAQHGTAAIHLYAPQFPAPGEGPFEAFGYLDYTHAYFPTEHFDEVVRAGRWTFGRKGDAYVGLWSWRQPEWREHDPDEVFTHGLTEPFDLVARGGTDNAWVVEVGDASDFESFTAFREALSRAPLAVTPRPAGDDGLPGGFDVAYESPGQGRMTFGWDGPLNVDGNAVAIDGYPRYDNRFARVDFDTTRYEISAEGRRLVLDFEAGTRTVE
jgi:hypothetical protein